MSETLYSLRHVPVIGFHGCDRQVAEAVVTGRATLKPSTNDYDWLGAGIYFWENNIERAWQWAKEEAKKGTKIKEPAVLGAILELGYCLDLLDSQRINDVKRAYDKLVNYLKLTGEPIPQNTKAVGTDDYVLRRLDCAVVMMAHKSSLMSSIGRPYDSVRSMFLEGGRLYEQSGFAEKNHVQVCVCNPNCVKGYFLPRSIDTDYPLP